MANPKILYILSSYNLYGGTPQKTLDLLNHFGDDSCLYVYFDAFKEFKPKFEATGAKVFECAFGRNIYRHIKRLLEILDSERINIVQVHFTFGELLGFFLKALRPRIKLIVVFEGALSPVGFKKKICEYGYGNVDSFVYISKYVKEQKERAFPRIRTKKSLVIYNATNKKIIFRKKRESVKRDISLLVVSSLIEMKNIDILVDAMDLIVNKYGRNKITLYVAGDGSEKIKLLKKIEKYGLEEHVLLLGYRKDVESLLSQSDIFLHPCYVEGFGISVVEAMTAGVPIIVSDSGALPELIKHEVSGLAVDPFDNEAWAQAILKLCNDVELAYKLSKRAREKVLDDFSVSRFVNSYEGLYREMVVFES